jgi:hypothetical protein
MGVGPIWKPVGWAGGVGWGTTATPLGAAGGNGAPADRPTGPVS